MPRYPTRFTFIHAVQIWPLLQSIPRSAHRWVYRLVNRHRSFGECEQVSFSFRTWLSKPNRIFRGQLVYGSDCIAHLCVDISIRGQDLIIARPVGLPPEVGDRPSRFTHQKYAGCRIPRMQAEFPEPSNRPQAMDARSSAEDPSRRTPCERSAKFQ
jgi:hypothetical protein